MKDRRIDYRKMSKAELIKAVEGISRAHDERLEEYLVHQQQLDQIRCDLDEIEAHYKTRCQLAIDVLSAVLGRPL